MASASIPVILPPNVSNKKDLLLSTQVYDLVDLLCEGPIYGFVDKSGVLQSGAGVAKSMYFNDVPLMDSDNNQPNFQHIEVAYNLGSGTQAPLATPKNISKEKAYGAQMIGPWVWHSGNATGSITVGGYTFPWSQNTATDASNETIDPRKYGGATIEYGRWWKTSLGSGEFPESTPVPIYHEIENYWVDKVRINLTVSSLFNIINTSTVTQDVGRKLPNYLKYNVEYGVRSPDGAVSSETVKSYTVSGIVESPYGQSIEIDLSSLQRSEGDSVFLKIYRTTSETVSPVIGRSIALDSVVEIVSRYPMSYPHSTVVGLTLDARTFRSPPQRTYAIRGKLIRIPSNYYPLQDASNASLLALGRPVKLNTMDWRRYDRGQTYATHTNGVESGSPTGKFPPAHIYRGNWDGSFKWGWTDNPVWILFDLLTNNIYGLGDMVDASMIDKWTLYQIGKYCDAVDDAGYFVGVKTLDGGKEPRYSCNVTIDTEQNAYDLLNYIAGIFRGVAYWFAGGIYFADDRPKEALTYFGNADVKDGIFVYQEAAKNSRYTVAEVAYNDRLDNWLPKTEYVEDPDGILNFGIIKNSSLAFGATSRSEARRLGLYQLYSSRLEPEILSFVAPQKAAYLRPGDVIGISDEIKQIKKYNGILKDKRLSGNRLYFDLDSPLPADLNTGSNLIVALPWGFAQLEDFNASGTGIPRYAIESMRTKQYISLRMDHISSDRMTVDVTGNQISVYNATQPTSGDLILDPSASVDSISLVEAFKYVPPLSLFVASGSGSDPSLYRVVSVKENNGVEFEINAVQYISKKFSIIENEQLGIDLSNPYFDNGIFNNLQKPNLVQNLFMAKTGISGSMFNILASWNTPVTPPSLSLGPPSQPYPYRVTLTTPSGVSITQQTTGLSGIFSGLTATGQYVVKAWAVGGSPNYLVSNPASYSSSFGSNTYALSGIYITGMSLRATDSTSFSIPSGSGRSLSDNVGVDWSLLLPDQSIISGSNSINSLFGISQNVYILNSGLSVVSGLTQSGYTSTSLLLDGGDLISAFGGTYPRDFYVRVVASGASAPSTASHTGTFKVSNPIGSINHVYVTDGTGYSYWDDSSYSSLDSIPITGEFMFNAYFNQSGGGDCIALNIYSGASGNFSPSGGNLLSRLYLGGGYLNNQEFNLTQNFLDSSGVLLADPFYLKMSLEDSIGTGTIFPSGGSLTAKYIIPLEDNVESVVDSLINSGQFLYGQKIFPSVAGTTVYTGTGSGSGSGRFGVGLPLESWSSLPTGLQAIFSSGDTISGSGIFPRKQFHVSGESLFDGDITVNGISYATTHTNTSDKNVKKNILKIKDALVKLRLLNGYEFDWKGSGEHANGVLAQEVEVVFPHAVFERQASPEEELMYGVSTIKTVDYAQLIPLLIEAVKELEEKPFENQQNTP